jgi:hypothetical protein
MGTRVWGGVCARGGGTYTHSAPLCRYEMKVDPATKAMVGQAKGSPDDWRRATFVKPLSEVEQLLFGGGGGTEWTLEYDGGKFGVQFKADGYNHFNCPSYPDHSHYKIDNNGTG